MVRKSERTRSTWLLIIALAVLSLAVGCGGGDSGGGGQAGTPPPSAPILSEVSSSTPRAGDRVILTGSRFGAGTTAGAALFGGVAAGIESWSDTQIVAIVPHDCPSRGNLVVVTAGGSSAALPYQRTMAWRTPTVVHDNTQAAPYVAALDPRPGHQGDAMLLYFDVDEVLRARRFSGSTGTFTTLPPTPGARVNSATGRIFRSDYQPYSLTIDAQGRALAVYLEGSDTLRTVQWSLYDPSQQHWSVGVESLSSPDATLANDPVIASDAEGNAICVFAETASENGAEVTRIMARRWVAATSAWDPRLIRLDAEGSPEEKATPTVAMDARGNAMCLFVTGYSRSQKDVVARRFERSRGWSEDAWSAEVTVNARALEVANPRLAVDATGNAVAVYVEQDGFRNPWMVARRYNVSTNAWDHGTTLSASGISVGLPPEAYGFPDVAFDPLGNALAIFSDAVVAGGGQSMRSFVRHRGTGEFADWEPAVQIDAGPQVAETSSFASLALDPLGTTGYACFYRRLASGEKRVTLARLDLATGLWSALENVDAGTGALDFPGENPPVLLPDALGNVGVIWAEGTTLLHNYYH